MSLNEFELHADRLSTTDASGKRIFLQPADVRGFFRRRRTQVEGRRRRPVDVGGEPLQLRLELSHTPHATGRAHARCAT